MGEKVTASHTTAMHSYNGAYAYKLFRLLKMSGLNVCFGHDDIFDPWYPLGTGNMLQVLHMRLNVCQIMGYSQINDSIDLISNNSARTLNIQDEYGIEIRKPGNLIILPSRERI